MDLNHWCDGRLKAGPGSEDSGAGQGCAANVQRILDSVPCHKNLKGA